MINGIFSDYLTFSEWYHYVLLVLWLAFLLIGIKYYSLIESLFKPKDGFNRGNKSGAHFLLASFFTGIVLFLVLTFKPAQIDSQAESAWNYFKYGFYGLFILLLVFNGIVTIRNYSSSSIVLRLILLSLFMTIYFYSGMLGGLLVIAIIALILVIYAIIKFKKILTIK